MALMIGFALSPAAAARAGDAPPPAPEPRLALEAFSRDRVVFDSGAALGRASASVPLRGTATPGAAVEARTVAEGGGATSWAEIATADPSGAWEGAVTAPKGAAWRRPQVRLAAAPGVARTGAHRFGVGHVIAVWGQSEIAQALQPNLSNTPAEALAHEDRVQVLFHDRVLSDANIGSGAAGVVLKHLATDAPHTAACAAMANLLTELDPDAPFCVVFQAQSGTSPTGGRGLFADDAGKPAGTANVRFWRDDLALHEFATADGQQVGAACMSWFASPAGLAFGYDDFMAAAMFRRDMAGEPVTIPGTVAYATPENNSSDSHAFVHCWDDLYDYDHTLWVPFGPHRFDPEQDMASSLGIAGGGTEFHFRNVERCRAAWEKLARATAVHGGAMAPIAVEALNYRNGEKVGGTWKDLIHPSDDTPDGLPQKLRLTAHAWARGAGVTSWTVPVLDEATLGAGGAHLELGSSAGDITTTRRARGEAPLPDTHDHWTDVVGFEVGGVPIRRAEIVGGRVRVYPNSGAFGADVLDGLRYLGGGATGALLRPEDHDAELWKDVAIVDVGAARVDGIAVRPLILPAALADAGGGDGAGSGDGGSGTGGSGSGSGGGSGSGDGGGDGGSGAGGDPAAFFTRTAQDARLADPATLGAGVGGVTAELVLRIGAPAQPGFKTLLEISGLTLKLDVDARPHRRQLRVTMRDPGNVMLIGGATSGLEAFELGTWTTIRLVALRDRGDGTGFVRILAGGGQVFPRSDAPGTGEFAASGDFASNRGFVLLAGRTPPVDLARVRIWKGARADGGLPEGAPYEAIEGGAAAANAHPWKTGDDFT